MYLNTIQPAPGSKKVGKRLGRGIGSGKGKTCGRGHKGQRARAGGYHKVGFEGGQMPLQRRLPKFGFNSRLAKDSAQIRLSDLNNLELATIRIDDLKVHQLVPRNVKKVKVIAAGKVEKAVHLVGIKVTAGARTAIETAGGKIED